MTIHVFVAMPFGIKEGIDFNRVYEDFIKPALKKEGFEVFRADEEQRAGNIRTDMFQELLLADLVVADLSIDNPNVWYELGVRHALRARGIIHIKCKRDYMPFDVFSDRALTYNIKNGVPDPDFLNNDMKNLAAMAKETVSSWHGHKISPVYNLLGYLKEPDWKSLRLDNAKEFWDKQETWQRRIEVARKKQNPGDIMVLADETPVRALSLEAHITAGKALRKLGQFSMALEQIEKALSIDPENLDARQEKGLLLGRLKKDDAAKEWVEAAVRDNPKSAETLALLGRLEKDIWISSWNINKKTQEEKVEAAACEDCLLCEAIDTYLKAFLLDSTNYYPGINAVTLMHIQKYLKKEEKKTELLVALEGGVRWAVRSALTKETPDSKDFWARVTLGDLEVLVSDTPVVEKAYKYAVAAAEKNWFALDSSSQQLLLLKDLGFCPPQVAAALKIFDNALEKLKEPEARLEPRLVFLFSGHMIDAPGRKEPRFPADKEDIAAKAIAAKLDELGACKDDLALCGGACGGDILFAEACLSRGIRLELRIPFNEPEFLRNSVIFAGDTWRERYYKVKNHQKTQLFIMPDELGTLPKGVDPYSRNNLWQLYTALSWNPEKVRFICLWNRKAGDGPGGTKHMHDEVIEHSGRVYVLDTNELFLGGSNYVKNSLS